MANAVVDTGHGATVTFGTSGYSFNIVSIDPGEETVGDISIDHLLVTGFKESTPEDLIDPGEVVITYQFDNEATQPTVRTAETLTVTLPTAAGPTTPATYAGTGYAKRVKRTSLQTNTIQDGEIIFKFDGKAGPTFTPAT